MELNSDWQKFHLAAEDSFQRGEITLAKELAAQLYESIGLFFREEQDNETTCDAYDVCLEFARRLNETSLAINSFYRMKLHSDEYIFPGVMWIDVLSRPDIPLVGKLKMIRDVRSILQEYEHKGQCIREIQVCYQFLMAQFPGNTSSFELIIREALLFDLENGWGLLKIGKFSFVCDMCRQMLKAYPSDPNQALIMELWANALEKLGMLDVAINKAENAIALADSRHNRASFEELLNRLTSNAQIQDASTHCTRKQTTDKQSEKGKKFVKRTRLAKEERWNVNGEETKRQATDSVENESDSILTCDSESQNDDSYILPTTLADNSPKSWKDVTEFDVPVSKPRRNRRRRRTGDSGISSNGTQNEKVDQSSEIDFEKLVVVEDDEEEFLPIQEGQFCDFNIEEPLQTTELYSICDDDDDDDDQEDTFFNESCERQLQSPETKVDLIHGFDEKISQNGIALSERFVMSFKRNKMKFAEYPELYPKDEALSLCSKNPKKFKHCKISIETAHGAVCTNLDEKDKVKCIEISGRSKCGKVYSEDHVVVEIISDLPETDYIPRLNRITNANTVSGDVVYGKVVGITQRTRFAGVNNPVFLCTLDIESYHLMKPICKTVPKISVLHNNCENQFQVETYIYDENSKDLKFQELKQIDPAKRKGYLFLVCLITWNELYPVGAILSVNSVSNSAISSLKILCLQNNIPTLYKESTVNRTNEIVQNPLKENEDVRENMADELQVFTIDPPGSKDLDDALSIKCIGENRYEVGVHIADVASVLEKDDAIDTEAQERTRTFYPGDGYRPHHMLPEPLSTNICSLLPNENRNAISFFFNINSSGEVENIADPVVKRTIVRSFCQFTYEEVQKIISGATEESKVDFCENIQILHKMALSRRKRRLGNKTFAFPFEGDYVKRSDKYYSAKDAHNLVEEFMLLTNHAVACYLFHKYPGCLPFRVQAKPSAEKVQEWMKSYPLIGRFVLGIQNLPLPDNTKINVSDIPTQRWNKIFPIQLHVWEEMKLSLENKDFEQVRHLVGTDELHPMQALAFEAWIQFQESAKYKCSGTIASKNEALHFSLGIFPYTHCTSPIRRFADIVVQRLIHASLDGQNSPYTTEEVNRLCEKINDVNKREKSFEKECFALHIGKKLSKKPTVCHTMIQDVTEKEASLHFPGMRKISKDCKLIPYSVLKVCAKPHLTTDENSRPLVSLKWRQRLYSHTGYAPKTQFQRNGDTVRIDPHQLVIYQQIPKWQKILKVIMNGKTSQLKDAFFGTDHPDVNMSKSVPACFNTETDVSSEVRGGNINRQCCDFSLSLNHGQILAVQIAAEAKRGVQVPTVQMIEVTRNVKLCIQHTSDPVKCFSRYSTQKIPRQFKSPVEYVKIWLSIFRMESTVKMNQDIPVVINDIPVNFFEKAESSDCNIILYKSFCAKRDIEFGCLSERIILFGDDLNDEEEKESKYLLSSDCVCIRCDLVNGVPSLVNYETSPDERQIWIGHGEINILQKSKKSGKMKVHIRLHKDSPTPTPEMCVNPPPRCSVEILQRADPDKRVEAIISCLSKATDLAKAIALGRKIPKLDKDHIDLSRKIGADVTICGLAPNNTKQLKAIQRALSSRFCLIQGPPGTGKTYTGIKLVHLFVNINKLLQKEGGDHKQVVFCGPSNKSVDLVARWMLKTFRESAPKMVRMYGSSIENTVYQIPGRDYAIRTSCKDNKADPDLESVSLHNLVRKDGKPYSEELRKFDELFRSNPDFSDVSEINKYKKLLSRACQDELKNYDVIFCTTAVATNARFLKATQGKIYQMIIDEAGMCTEPETLAPIISSKAEQVVLIGDHKQLQPVVLCSEAASLGLDKSLFERYADQAIFLDCQYRMNPRICDFPSKEFYDGKLETMPSIAWKVTEPLSLWRVPNVPHMFCHVEGEEETLQVTTDEGNQQSKSNKAEVEHVVRIFKDLVKREKINLRHVNIISQYNAQCYAIRKALEREGYTGYNVNTVVASQGGEWDYVIFSTVRSLPGYRIEPNPTLGWCKHNLGFITDHHQINVALTRARKGLIIIGNKNLMKCDMVWKNLLAHYGRQGCVMDAESVRSKRQKKKQKHREASEDQFYS